jgi:hypothetical protein
MMNVFLVLSAFPIIIVMLFGCFFTMKRWRAAQKPRAKRRSTRRFQQQRITGMYPLLLRASRPRRAAHPPVVQVLPQAVAPAPQDHSEITSPEKAALQTTVYALPIPHPLILPTCPRCNNKQTATHDVFVELVVCACIARRNIMNESNTSVSSVLLGLW